jgi:hypothetical protein
MHLHPNPSILASSTSRYMSYESSRTEGFLNSSTSQSVTKQQQEAEIPAWCVQHERLEKMQNSRSCLNEALAFVWKLGFLTG